MASRELGIELTTALRAYNTVHSFRMRLPVTAKGDRGTKSNDCRAKCKTLRSGSGCRAAHDLVHLKGHVEGFLAGIGSDGGDDESRRRAAGPVHKNEDEWFFLAQGEMRFNVGDEVFRGTAGSFVSFPRGIPHTFSIDSESARFLVINTPGGFERMFELAPKTPEDAARAMEAFGMTFVAPHPGHAAVA